MVWGTGTYGYRESDLELFYNTYGVNNDVKYIKTYGNIKDSGANFVEGSLDVQMISGIATKIITYVANTDNSADTESSDGFGDALLQFLISFRNKYENDYVNMPKVISISLGSLSFSSCDLLCKNSIIEDNTIKYDDCMK